MKSSLKRRFLLVVVVLTVLIAVILGGSSIWLIRSTFREIQAERLVALSSFAARELEHELRLRSEFFRQLAYVPVLRDFHETNRVLAVKEFLAEENAIFQEIEIIDPAGRILLDVEKSPRETAPDPKRSDPVLTEALLAPGLVRWEVTVKTGEGPQFVAYLGLKSYYGDNVWGCLRGEVPFAELASHVETLKHEQGAVYLVHPQIGILPMTTHLEEKPLESHLAAFLKELHPVVPSSGVHEFRIGDSVYLSTEAPVFGTDWKMVAVLDQGSFFAMSRQIVSTLALLSAACLLAGGIVAFRFGREITAPLEKITRATVDAASGKFLKIDDTQAPGEVRELLESFNNMVCRLQQATVSRDYLECILHSMRESLFVVGMDGIVQRANPALCALLGYERQEMEGLPVQNLFASTDKPWLDLVSRGAGSIEERVLRHKDGSSMTVLFSWARFNDVNGQTQGIICIAQGAGPAKPPSRRWPQRRPANSE